MRNHKSKEGIAESANLVKTLTNRAKLKAAQGSSGGIEGTVLSFLKQGPWAETWRKEWALVPLPLSQTKRGSTGIKSKRDKIFETKTKTKGWVWRPLDFKLFYGLFC